MYNDWSEIDLGRLERAAKLKLINVSDDYMNAECVGSGKENYRITAKSCSCPDYKKAGRVCKHMIALAYLRGDIDLKSMIEIRKTEIEIQECKEALSKAFGDYYLFNDPSIPDVEYDNLKRRYCELTGEILE